MKKYVVCPGTIQSINDGQFHYISSYKLCHLYGVDHKECYFLCHFSDAFTVNNILSEERKDELIYLLPQFRAHHYNLKLMRSVKQIRESAAMPIFLTTREVIDNEEK
jgi:hypothetical protein